MTDAMPPIIKARPMMGTVDATTGHWAMDDPYLNATNFYHADLYLAAKARVAELEAQAIGFRESIRKAALDSELGHEILDLCWNSYFTAR
jgi:hypothetical protein